MLVTGDACGGGALGYGFHAFLWIRARGMLDLNDLIPPDSGWALCEAYAVNGGQIVGQGIFNGQRRAFLFADEVPPTWVNGTLVATNVTSTSISLMWVGDRNKLLRRVPRPVGTPEEALRDLVWSPQLYVN